MRSASYVLALATLLNFVNYIDRFILAAVLPRIKSELVLNDFQLGMLANAFLVAYFITSPLFGRLGDRRSRPRLIAAGVAALEPGHRGCRARPLVHATGRCASRRRRRRGGIRDDLSGVARRFLSGLSGGAGCSRFSTSRFRSAPRSASCSAARSSGRLDGAWPSWPWACRAWRWRRWRRRCPSPAPRAALERRARSTPWP